jgi:drug/metabolite transporter (DMT)-like permease
MNRLTHNPLGIMLIVTTVGAVGQILLKIGMSQSVNKPTLLEIAKIMFSEPRVFCGLILFALNTILYLRVLQEYPLSLVYPMIAFSYVVVTFLSWLLLGESIPPLRVLGLMVIIGGVLLLALSNRPSKTTPQNAATPPPASEAADASGS